MTFLSKESKSQVDDAEIERKAQTLVAKTQHYLITTVGRTTEDATPEEFYRAFCYALREEIMINWLASSRTREERQVRMLYYLSMEYLPGKALSNTVCNLDAEGIVERVFFLMNRSWGEILACEREPGLGNGGLGRLASCLLDSLATADYPAQAYGLRYQYGIFEQQLWNGEQVEVPDCWLLSETPWEFRRDLRRVSVEYGGEVSPAQNLHGDAIYQLNRCEEVWALPYDMPIIGYSPTPNFSVVTMRLWSTKESPRNFQLQRYNAGQLDQAAENMTLTDLLYPSDNQAFGKRIRLKQEFLLVSASLQDIIHHYSSRYDNFRSFADKVRIQINDTHPALVIAELIRLLMSEHDLPWKTAVEITRTCTGYTNHTVLSEALEQWSQELMSLLLPRQTKVIERLNLDCLQAVRSRYPSDEERVRRMSIIENGMVRMANLSLWGSHAVNGVAELHTQILRQQLFKDFFDMFPEKFFAITNGVSQRRWLLHCNPELAHFISQRIGSRWITHLDELSKLHPWSDDAASQQEFLEIKQRNKEKLAAFLAGHNTPRNERGEAAGVPPVIHPSMLFDVQIKRVHEYKRQLLNALHLIFLYRELLQFPNHNRVPRAVFFGGKAAASYAAAKEIILLINCIARKVNSNPATRNHLRVVYVENYCVSKAEVIIPAAELSEQISTAGMEASGTGNMKLSLNGALTIGTEDGANIEMKAAIGSEDWPLSFGAKANEIELLRNRGGYSSQQLYDGVSAIQEVLNTLCDHTFAITEREHTAFCHLFDRLLGKNHQAGDSYFVLHDFIAYCEAQKRAEELYRTPSEWARLAIRQIAGMGRFSSDRAVEEYAQKIWGITPCPVDEALLEEIRSQYRANDRCRIY